MSEGAARPVRPALLAFRAAATHDRRIHDAHRLALDGPSPRETDDTGVAEDQG